MTTRVNAFVKLNAPVPVDVCGASKPRLVVSATDRLRDSSKSCAMFPFN